MQIKIMLYLANLWYGALILVMLVSHILVITLISDPKRLHLLSGMYQAILSKDYTKMAEGEEYGNAAQCP